MTLRNLGMSSWRDYGVGHRPQSATTSCWGFMSYDANDSDTLECNNLPPRRESLTPPGGPRTDDWGERRKPQFSSDKIRCVDGKYKKFVYCRKGSEEGRFIYRLGEKENIVWGMMRETGYSWVIKQLLEESHVTSPNLCQWNYLTLLLLFRIIFAIYEVNLIFINCYINGVRGTDLSSDTLLHYRKTKSSVTWVNH